MSRKDESEPVAQKYCQGFDTPSEEPFACRTASAGIIVAKMEAKSTTTSTKGCQENSFSACSLRGVRT